MEELRIQRQKRIAERSGTNPVTSSRRSSTENKTSIKSQPLNQDTKKTPKPVLRSSTVERLATARNTAKISSVDKSKSSQPKRPTLKENGSSTTISQKTNRVEDKKSSSNKVKSSDNKNVTDKVLSSDSDAQGKESKEVTVELPTEPAASKVTEPTVIVDDFKDIQELQSTPIQKSDRNAVSQRNTSAEDKPVQLGQVKGDEEFTKASTVVSEDKRAGEAFVEDIPVKFSTVNIEGNDTVEEKYISASISEIEISTPPPNDGMDTESAVLHSRKKWNNDEVSPKAAKGFRKLLFFGKKS